MQQYRIRCHKNGNIAAFTIKNFTKDQLFLTEYLQNKLHSFNELIYFLTKAILFDAAFEGFFLNNEIDVEIEQEEISYSDESSNWLDEYTENKETEMDSKTTNCSSIALLLEYKNLKMLFPGDSPIQLFENELPEEFDLIKLPHHGSVKNISLEFIKNTKVKYYLLSTDGNRYGHPGKAVIANIIKHTENNTKLIKNYNVSLLAILLSSIYMATFTSSWKSRCGKKMYYKRIFAIKEQKRNR